MTLEAIIIRADGALAETEDLRLQDFALLVARQRQRIAFAVQWRRDVGARGLRVDDLRRHVALD